MSASVQPLATLETWVQEMHDCERCGGEQIFIAAWSCEAGLVGCCLGCGEEKLVRWSRTNSEAA